MTTDVPATMRQVQSLVTDAGEVRVAVVEVPVPAPGPDEVLVRVEASPINPSDLGLLLAGTDPSDVTSSGAADEPAATGSVPAGALAMLAARVGRPMPVGNEGAGVVMAAGSSPEAQALLGRTVAALGGGGMYAEYRSVPVAQCLLLPDGTPPADGASCFVNPLTALGMVETMRLEGHTALVHTAAASNLGQMLVRICQADGVELVNVVRKPEQVDLLRSIGAEHVCNSTADTFTDDLVAALTATGATIAFDAVGGGPLTGQLLAAMEAAVVARADEGTVFNRYGSSVHKQVYIYGSLDRGPTQFTRTFGLAWGISGWLLTNFLVRVGPEVAQRLRQRVVDELTTTFASHYAREIFLEEVVSPEAIAAYGRQATGEKYLVTPQR
jgi:NADPH:quinone reductase-like Zn-dependent oxidoreductase